MNPNDTALIARLMDPKRGSEVLLGELLAPAIRDSYAAIEAAARGADLLVSHPATMAAPKPGCRAVLLVGRNPENHPKGVLPQGVIAVDYAPHQQLFPRAAVIVHQGGMGTTSQALRAGKPELIVPYAHDQPDNAQRVNRLGVARICPPRRFRSSRVAAHLRDLLGEAQYRTRAEAVGRAVREEDGAAAACDAIEAVLRT